MFQLARAKQRHIEPVRTPAVSHAPAFAVGKRTLTEQLEARSLGAPDYYTRAIEAAQRELGAVRATALPAFIAVLRKRDIAPLTKQIELARAAMQVRHLLLCANKHVDALEHAMTLQDPMVLFLRANLDVLVQRATKLGVYRGAEDMIPRRYVEETPKPFVKTAHKVVQKTAHKPTDAPSQIATLAKPAQITQPPRTRLARGTGAVPLRRATLTKQRSGGGSGGAPTKYPHAARPAH